MKLEVVKEKLQAVIGGVERIPLKSPTHPILATLFLSAKRGALLARATNLELGVEYSLPVRVEREGEAVVPAAAFAGFIANLPNIKSVFLEASSGKLTVTAGGARATFTTLAADDFPTIPKAEGVSFSLSSELFAQGFRSVHYAAALGNLKPELSSVYLFHEGDELMFVATDSFRLAEKRALLKKPPAFPPVLVPVKNVAEIIRLLDREDGEVRVFVGKGCLSLQGERLSLTTRLVEGAYPDYQQIIPKEFAAEAVALREEALSALRLVTPFSDRFNQMRMHLEPKNKRFEFSVRNGEVGESVVALAAALSGEELGSNFNYRYISDCLSALRADSVSFSWSGENRPLLIRGVGDRSFRYLVMPMNR